MNEPTRREYRTWSLDSRRWDGYVPRPDDIVIATAPKCGTTWMQQIVSSLIFQDATPRALPALSLWVDARFRGAASDMFARRGGERTFCSSTSMICTRIWKVKCAASPRSSRSR